MPARTNLDEIDERDLEGFDPTLLAVGYELRPSNMRPSLWRFEAGESNEWHRHEKQEELYFLVEGAAELELSEETWSLTAGDLVVVEPEVWRQLTAKSDCLLFAVGVPPVAHDAVFD